MKTNSQERCFLTEKATQLTSERFCTRCYRYRNALTGELKKTSGGRTRWTCSVCNEGWKRNRAVSKTSRPCNVSPESKSEIPAIAGASTNITKTRSKEQITP